MLSLHTLKAPHWLGRITAVVNSDPVNAYYVTFEAKNVMNYTSSRTGINDDETQDLIFPLSRWVLRFLLLNGY